MKVFTLGCLGVIAGIVVIGIIATVLAAVAINSDSKTKAFITGDAGDVTVSVGGGTTEGFSGSIGAAGNSRSISGVAPQSFIVAGKDSHGIIVAVIQAKGRMGTVPLTVALEGCADGAPHSGATTADFGVVTVSC